MKKNLLVIPEVEAFLEKYKEEIAHEFGIFRSIHETEATVDMAKRLLTKKGTKEQTKKKEKGDEAK
ncbi:hypothetical protein [Alkalihalobacterium bogoriense]|uniref:hypothetical protein n=1 Tax=Alkalihalobacterium bogoriense TaxID=246272 RepID=UPI00047A60D5|nr:hypothetical protein [Alkalihalobacterium bogoriense]